MKKSDFKPIHKETHNRRLAMIEILSKNKYIDDGPLALYFAVKNMQNKGLHGNVEFCLLELERIYYLDIFRRKAALWFKKDK